MLKNLFKASTLSLLGCSLVLSNTALADQALTMTLHAFKVDQVEDRTVYTPVSTAPVGTVIQYRAIYTNNIDRPINDVMVVLPIPTDMTFTGSAYPPSAQASIDDKYYADMPLMRRVSGSLEKVPYSEYTSLRWNIKYLPPHKSADVALNATID